HTEIAEEYKIGVGYVSALKTGHRRSSAIGLTPVFRNRAGKKPELSDDQVRAIRADPRGWDAIANEYHIKQHMVGNIKSKYRYARVEGPQSVPSPKGVPPLKDGPIMNLCRLTEEQIRAIHSDTRFFRVIAHEYGIDREDVSAIKKRLSVDHGSVRSTKGSL